MRRRTSPNVDPALRTRRLDAPLLPAPEGLEVATFDLGDDEYAIFAFPIAKPALPRGLSSAEQEVVRGVLAGHSNSEIAVARATSVHTVANQLRSVYAKLDISGRSELVRHCLRDGVEVK
jgi:DNA-binding CsgD family transcriptional regulator